MSLKIENSRHVAKSRPVCDNLLRADDIKFALEQLVASLLASSTLLQDDSNLFQTCQQLGTSSANTSC
jgi:hypothetical protein